MTVSSKNMWMRSGFLILAGMMLLESPARAFQVTGIDVEGARRVERDTILSYLHVKPGDTYQPTLVDEGIKDLYSTNLFSSVVVQPKGNRLVVKVEENPVINQVAFEGNRRGKDDTLKAEILSKPRTTLTPARVQSDIQRLLTIYRQMGRYGAKIETKIIKLPENRVDLVFEINEGPRTTVRSILITGNKAFSTGSVKSVLSTKESRWWRFFSSTDSYDPDRMAYDRELLRKFYTENGYLDFRVLSSFAELTQDQSSFILTYSLNEGERYRVDNTVVECSLPNIDPLLFQSKILLREGDWFNAKQVEETIENLKSVLADRGYPFVHIYPQLDKNSEAHTVSLRFQVKEGQKAYVGRLEIEGNTVTEDRVIRRQFTLFEGDPFNDTLIKKAEQRIKDLNYFSKVDIVPEKSETPSRVNLRVGVKEKATGELQLAGGVGTLEGLLGTVRYTEYNLMGKGQILSTAFTLSKRTQDFDISFTEPFFRDKDLTTGVDLFRTRTNQTSQTGFIYSKVGFSLRMGYMLSENLAQRWTYTLRRDRVYDVKDNASAIIKEQEGSAVVSEVAHEITYGTQDSYRNPTRGFVISLTNVVAGLGGDTQLLRNILGWRYNQMLIEDVILVLRARGGILNRFGGYKLLIKDRYQLGGEGTDLRGFGFGGVGPREQTPNDSKTPKTVPNNNSLGGRFFYTASAEVTFPIGLPNELGVRGAVFFDAGSLWNSGLPSANVYDSRSIRASTGFGIAWNSPMGSLRLDFVKPLRYQWYDNRQTIQFSISSPTL